MTPTGGLPAGRLAGIPVVIHPLWFLVVALFTAMLGAGYYPDEVPGAAPAVCYLLGFLSVLGLFGSVLLHELGHALVARGRDRDRAHRALAARRDRPAAPPPRHPPGSS